LLRLHALDPQWSVDRQDSEWRLTWQEADLEGCADLAAEERERYRQAVRRLALRVELEQALADQDHAVLLRLRNDPLLADYPPLMERVKEIDQLIAVGRQTEIVLDLLRSGGAGDSAELPDLSCVEVSPVLFRPHRDELRALLERALGKASLRLIGQPELLGQPGTSRVVKLNLGGLSWPRLGLGERICLVATALTEFFDRPPEKRTSEAHESGMAHGLRLPAPASFTSICVTIWPVVRLNKLDVQVIGKPLHVGPISLAVEEKPTSPLRTWLGKVLSNR
jgi:hypothetical protein